MHAHASSPHKPTCHEIASGLNRGFDPARHPRHERADTKNVSGEMLLLLVAATSFAQPSSLHLSRPHLPSSQRSSRNILSGDRTIEDERVPSMRELVGFSIPLLGVGLTPPVLGLIDTAVVGRHAGSLALAALAPSVALCDITSYLFLGLGVATTNFVASAIANGDYARERREVRNALFFASVWGVVSGTILFVGCLPMIKLLAGGAVSAGGFPIADACAYARWRAVGFPFALLFMALQATFLGARDWRPPTLAAAVACATNLCADLVLVVVLRLGVVGAAVGTVLAQIAAFATLATIRWRREQARGAKKGDGPEGTATAHVEWLPSRRELIAWSSFGVPLAVGQVTRCTTFAQITAAATSGGAVAAAAHQVAMGLFYSTLPFGDAISTSAQAFLPALRSPSRRRQMINRVLRLGALTGCGTCAAIGLPLALPILRSAFTTDVAIATALGGLLPFACVCSFCFNVASSAEGCLLATRDLRTVALLYTSSPFIACGVLLALSKSALGASLGARAAWLAFSTFHVVRLSVFVGRATRRDAAASSVTSGA